MKLIQAQIKIAEHEVVGDNIQRFLAVDPRCSLTNASTINFWPDVKNIEAPLRPSLIRGPRMHRKLASIVNNNDRGRVDGGYTHSAG